MSSEPRINRTDAASAYLHVMDHESAARLWMDKIGDLSLAVQAIPLHQALGLVLATDLMAPGDVPAFDRSNFDGYAVQAESTYGASEEIPARLKLNAESLASGIVPVEEVRPGTATSIATGGMIPRGADAVVLVEHSEIHDGRLEVHRPVASGHGITFAGTDIARGERILSAHTLLTPRETGIVAALGLDVVSVFRRPRVVVISTGDELIEPGHPLRPGMVHDANATLIADSAREIGADVQVLGIVHDELNALADAIEAARTSADLILLSGGTSKGEGDLSYRILSRYEPGVLVHGVALKPGKPVCLGAIGRLPVAVLPGFPTSAIFTFHLFVAPLLRHWLGLPPTQSATRQARIPVRLNSEPGRAEFVLVNLVEGPQGIAAYPLGKGSGSVTTFSLADGFLMIPRHREYLEAEETVDVTLLGLELRPVDLQVIGSHCVGLELLLSRLGRDGFRTKSLWVGSEGGLSAARRGECDLAGIHLLDPQTRIYNEPFLTPELRLLRGYGRLQGFVHRPDDHRFEGLTIDEAFALAASDPNCRMVNRNRGSGTRILIDEHLVGVRPPGYAVEARSHTAVAAAIVQRRADWGVAIEPVARDHGLGFIPLGFERYDFIVPEDRWERPAMQAFRRRLADPETQAQLESLGFTFRESPVDVQPRSNRPLRRT